MDLYRFLLTDTPTTQMYSLSLHDALPICIVVVELIALAQQEAGMAAAVAIDAVFEPDRKSTRLNSSHVEISYAVFCLKKRMVCGYSTIRIAHALYYLMCAVVRVRLAALCV